MKAILTYHSVDKTGSVISVEPSLFDQQVRWMSAGHVSVVSLTELLQVPDDRDALAITFDDAFTNFQTHAWPRLKDCGLPVTLFTPTAFVGRTNGWSAIAGGSMPTLSILDWDSLGRLHEQGATLGAHSRTHPDMRALSEAQAEDEVLGSIEDIHRHTGHRPATFAYPYGYWNARAASVVQRMCSHACTTELRVLHRSDARHLLPRLDMFYVRGLGRLESYGSATFGAYIQGRASIRSVGQWARARFNI
jgi:peptidoglycan/xylan/chitin deacetylase (PgdA/CDA1 family)